MVAIPGYKYTYQYPLDFAGMDVTIPFNVDFLRKLSCSPVFAKHAAWRLHKFNLVIESEVARLSQTFPGQVKMVDITALPKAFDELAGDGFHPSLLGQKRIAEAIKNALETSQN